MESEAKQATEAPSEGMSLDQLSQAFAAMLGQDAAANDTDKLNSAGNAATNDGGNSQAEHVAVNPRSVIEALLFVGRPDNSAPDGQQLASFMQGVSAEEVAGHIDALNEQYKTDGRPYEIVFSLGGFRFQLRGEFSALRDRFLGRMRAARLSPGAVEVLSLVAYHELLTADDVNRFRGKPSGHILSQLVRRKLLRLERLGEKKRGKVHYFTTPRFLKLFHLQSLAELPRSDDLQHQ